MERKPHNTGSIIGAVVLLVVVLLGLYVGGSRALPFAVLPCTCNAKTPALLPSPTI